MGFFQNGSISKSAAILIVPVILILLSSASFARPVHIKLVDESKVLNFEESHSQRFEGKGDDDEGQTFFGMPGFFLFPFSSHPYFRNSSVPSAEASFLQILVLTTGTFMLLRLTN